jgi:hypothetical protein
LFKSVLRNYWLLWKTSYFGFENINGNNSNFLQKQI